MEAKTNNNGFSNTKAARHLQNTLNEDRTVEAIDRLLQRIDTLEATVEQLSLLIEQGPGMVAMVADTADEAYRKASANGIDLEQRLGAALQIAEKLTAPAMVKRLEDLTVLMDQAPGLVAMAMDTFDEEIQRLGERNIDVKALTELAEHMTTSVSEANKMPVAKVGGIMSMIRTMRDPDRQKAIGYFMNIAKLFGQKI